MSKLIDTLDQIDKIMSEARELKERLELIEEAETEIRPSEAGELWIFTDEGGSVPFFTTEAGPVFPVNNHLVIRNRSGLAMEIKTLGLGEIIHNQNGWKRLHPPVNDGEVIVIEGVYGWQQVGETTHSTEHKVSIPKSYDPIAGLLEINKPMTMTLTIPNKD